MLSGLGLQRILLGGQHHGAARQPALDLQPHRVVERLHHEQDDRAARGPLDPERAERLSRMPERGEREVKRPGAAPAGGDHQLAQEALAVSARAVGDDLDMRVGVGVDARCDRNRVTEVIA